MGGNISSFLFYEEPKNTEYYDNIFNSLNKISKNLDDTENMIKEIDECIKNQPQLETTMEWDYYDLPVMETKNLSTNTIINS